MPDILKEVEVEMLIYLLSEAKKGLSKQQDI
jgi:hypothetical protein